MEKTTKLNNNELNELFNNLKEKKFNKSDVPIKKQIKTVKCCSAAKKINTIGNAYKDIIKGIEVCLVKTENNGVYKTIAYSRCSKTIKEGQTTCHLHINIILKQWVREGLKKKIWIIILYLQIKIIQF